MLSKSLWCQKVSLSLYHCRFVCRHHLQDHSFTRLESTIVQEAFCYRRTYQHVNTWVAKLVRALGFSIVLVIDAKKQIMSLRIHIGIGDVSIRGYWKKLFRVVVTFVVIIIFS